MSRLRKWLKANLKYKNKFSFNEQQIFFLQKFESLCTNIYDKTEKQRHKGIIYHYTNYDSLEKILESRRIRNTDYRYFNDPTELKYGQEIILELINGSSILNKQRFVQEINTIFDIHNNKCNVYISCYSSQIRKLALWRYYANNGCGFAIGFNDKYQIQNTAEEICL